MIEKIKSKLIEQKKTKTKRNLYYYTQINFSYNSNRILGSLLTKEQTEAIFNTNYVDEDNMSNDDIIETKNHFRLFDYILDNFYEKLSLDMIIKMHEILKKNTSDEINELYNVGGR